MRMRGIFSLLTALVFSLQSTHAQVQCIADASFSNSQCGSLYDMLADGRPVIMAIGNIHTQSSERLLGSGLLQKLAVDHGVKFGDQFSSKELRVAFVNVQVLSEETTPSVSGLQLLSMNENDETLDKAGWNELYSIYATRLVLVTPDHLVRPLVGKTAEEVYDEVRLWSSKIHPERTPDVRLLDATVSSNGKEAAIRVQNFSTSKLHGLSILVLKDEKEIAHADYNDDINALEDALIPVRLPEGAGARLTVIAKVDGDTNELNNSWVGELRTAVDASMIAGTFMK